MPLPDSGAASALEPPRVVVPTTAGDMAPSEENAPSRPALDAASAGMATGATARSDDETAAPTDAGTTAPLPVASDCRALGGFAISSTSSCYSFLVATFSWQRARNVCQEWGGDLVEIGSAEENGALAALATGSVWIGANDEEQEGTFRWAGGGLVDYAAWAPNQPDNWEGVEDCGELHGFDQLWNDRPCADMFAKQALCERVPNMTED